MRESERGGSRAGRRIALCVGLWAVMVACGCTAVRGGADPIPATQTVAHGWRFLGAGRAQLGTLRVRADVALLIGVDGRMRFDVALPTGAIAAVLWVLEDRWILLEPAANRAVVGQLAQALQAEVQLDALSEAVIAFAGAVAVLNRQHRFVKLNDLVPPELAAAKAGGDGRFRVEIESADRAVVHAGEGPPWTVTLEGAPITAGGWPQTWRMRGVEGDHLHVDWHRAVPLKAESRNLLRPDIPASFSVYSFADLQP